MEIRFNWKYREHSFIQKYLYVPLSLYTSTRAWEIPGDTQQRFIIHFFGLRSDVLFAGHLLSSLTEFVIRSTNEYPCTSKKERESFMIGCVSRVET